MGVTIPPKPPAPTPWAAEGNSDWAVAQAQKDALAATAKGVSPKDKIAALKDLQAVAGYAKTDLEIEAQLDPLGTTAGLKANVTADLAKLQKALTDVKGTEMNVKVADTVNGILNTVQATQLAQGQLNSGSHGLQGLSASAQARVAASADTNLLMGNGTSLTDPSKTYATATSFNDTIKSAPGSTAGIAGVRAGKMPTQIMDYLYSINHAPAASALSADAIKLRTDFLTKPLGATKNLDVVITAAQGDTAFQGAIAAKLGWEFPNAVDGKGAPVNFTNIAKSTSGAALSAALAPYMASGSVADPLSAKHQLLYGELKASQPQTSDLLNKAPNSFLQNLVGGADKGTKLNPQNISLQNWKDALTAAKNNGLGAAVVQSYLAAAEAAGHDKIGFAKSFAAALAEVNKGTDLNSVATRTYPPLTFSTGPVPAAVKLGLTDTTSSLAQMTGNWTTQQAAEALLGLQQLHTTYSGFGSVPNANAIVAGVIASQQNGDNKALLQKCWAQVCADPKAPATVNFINKLKGDLVADPLAGVTL